MPLLEKVREISGDGTCGSLQSSNIIHAVPVNFVRGLTFNDSVVIVDEAQNLTKSEHVTILTSFGKNTKYIVCGDLKQSDIGKASGYDEIYKRFDKEKCVDNEIVLTIRDEGSGIPEEDMKHLFERFFRGKNVVNIQGTGLGLHIVSKYVELMGGTIHVGSALEKGTRFTIKSKLSVPSWPFVTQLTAITDLIRFLFDLLKPSSHLLIVWAVVLMFFAVSRR